MNKNGEAHLVRRADARRHFILPDDIIILTPWYMKETRSKWTCGLTTTYEPMFRATCIVDAAKSHHRNTNTSFNVFRAIIKCPNVKKSMDAEERLAHDITERVRALRTVWTSLGEDLDESVLNTLGDLTSVYEGGYFYPATMHYLIHGGDDAREAAVDIIHTIARIRKEHGCRVTETIALMSRDKFSNSEYV